MRSSEQRGVGMNSHRLAVLTVVVLLFSPAGLPKDKRTDPAAIGNRHVTGGINFYSLEQEIALGRQLAREIESRVRIVDEPAVAEYVNRVGQKLVRNSDAQAPFTIKVIDDDEVNAFALPGGFLFVNTGLIVSAASEAELAGIIAHEIAHVACRHATRQDTRMQIMRLAFIPLILFSGSAGYAVQGAAAVAVPLGFLQFSRGFEEEADLFGVQYAYKAGYDPTAIIDFFERLEAREARAPGTMAKMFSTHPTTGSRIRRAQKYIGKFLESKPECVVNTSEFDKVRGRLIAIRDRRRLLRIDLSQPRLRIPRRE